MKKAALLSYSLFFVSYSLFLSSCSLSKQINKQAEKLLFADSSIKQGHIGISIYDPSSNKYLYNHNAEKYFIPASNTKLFSWYAGMKYLGDSLVGARYLEYQDKLIIKSAADPTFLNKEFPHQPVHDLMKTVGKIIVLRNNHFLTTGLGNGWAWNDYLETYMVERSAFPMYGNLVLFSNVNDSMLSVFGSTDTATIFAIPKLFSQYEFSPSKKVIFDQISLADNLIGGKPDTQPYFKIHRELANNLFKPIITDSKQANQILPFVPTDNVVHRLLADTLHKEVTNGNRYFTGHENIRFKELAKTIHSQPTDSLLKPMMHRSDNFFAEQTLLMVSNEKLGYMSDEAIIDTLLKYDLKDIPQKPRWVDGSGLSRYNLFTPKDFVWLLNKTKNEFDWERIKNILPTGGEGTLSSYYKDDAGFIYAKTGTLSNNCALSGFLITKKNKILIFSVLVNNYPTGATPIRRAVEKFIKQIRQKY